jgi:hypothetical protein
LLTYRFSLANNGLFRNASEDTEQLQVRLPKREIQRRKRLSEDNLSPLQQFCAT